MFYDAFISLCEDKRVKPGRAADDMGINRATVTSWKKSGYTPRAEQLSKIAEYFEVPTDFLLQRPPFEYWDKINENRAEFFHYADFDPELLEIAYGIDSNLLEAEPIKPIIDFLAEQVESARPLENGGWEIKMKSSYNTKTAPALTEKDERDIGKDLERIMEQLEAGGDLMFDGDPMSDEARESIKAAMKLGLEAAKLKNKERFTPKQYRKE